MENKEEILQALHEFERMADDNRSMSPELESVVSHIAKTGQVLFPWNALKPLFVFKLDKVMRDFFESSPSRNSSSSEPTQTAEFEVMRQRLLDCFDTFTSAPFTIQRLCELMVEPRKHYHNSEKFMRGVEKNVLVVSTIDAEMENDREFFNNVDGAHTVPSLPAMNGPLMNGESVMTVAVSTAGQSVTTDCQEGSQNSSNNDDRLSLHMNSQHSPSSVTTNGESARLQNIDVSCSHRSSVAENGENKAAEENKENQNEELASAALSKAAQPRHSDGDQSETGEQCTSTPVKESAEENSQTSEKTSSEDKKEQEIEDPDLATTKNEDEETKKAAAEPMDQSE